jgi:hypothetical protein
VRIAAQKQMPGGSRESAYHVGASAEDGTHAHKAVVLDRARLQHAPVTCTIVPTPPKENVSSHEAKTREPSGCTEKKKKKGANDDG